MKYVAEQYPPAHKHYIRNDYRVRDTERDTIIATFFDYPGNAPKEHAEALAKTLNQQ